MAWTNDGAAGISLGGFVLNMIEQVRAVGRVSASDREAKRISVSSVALSIPFDQGDGQPPLHPPASPLRPEELIVYLKANERRIRVHSDGLLNLPEGRVGRLELTVMFGR
jgi:hypothetical protein